MNKDYVVEYSTGKVRLIKANALVSDSTDMEDIEFWEDRLKNINQPFAVVFRRVKDKVLYSVFSELKKKGSSFRCG